MLLIQLLREGRLFHDTALRATLSALTSARTALGIARRASELRVATAELDRVLNEVRIHAALEAVANDAGGDDEHGIAMVMTANNPDMTVAEAREIGQLISG